MSLFDKLKKSTPEVKEKVSDLAAEHGDKIDDAIDKAADLADKATGGKHTDKIEGVADKAKDAAGKLAGDSE
ncbi:MAG: antitoxin [Aeromicrobium sp.]|uniref:antitoxin n=1 Tax=Aeromicrobium sp. TaxID=1871063 RepID=UPI0039E42CEF